MNHIIMTLALTLLASAPSNQTPVATYAQLAPEEQALVCFGFANGFSARTIVDGMLEYERTGATTTDSLEFGNALNGSDTLDDLLSIFENSPPDFTLGQAYAFSKYAVIQAQAQKEHSDD